MRQVVLDTETTGLDVTQGHRIIEIGCVELVNRRRTRNTFHHYLQPDRDIDSAAQEVHGISMEQLAGKPRFSDIAGDFLEFVSGAELVIHNAEFDVGFLNRELELARVEPPVIESCCTVIDSLMLARQLHPGQRNSLDALCRRYEIDNSGRDLHGALLDAQLLADVYLAMTGGQATLSLGYEHKTVRVTAASTPVDRDGLRLKVVRASRTEIAAHEQQLDLIDAASPAGALWRRHEV